MSTLMSTHDFVDLGVYVYIFYVILYNYIYIEIIYILYFICQGENERTSKQLEAFEAPGCTLSFNQERQHLPTCSPNSFC